MVEDTFRQPNAGPEGTSKLRLDGLAKRYGQVTALEPTTLDVAAGELMTILGPSGSGKTTLLQLVAGLVEPTAGRLLLDGRDQAGIPPHRRDIGVVFQDYALFPHLTVAENVAFPLQMRRVSASERRRRVANVLAMVGLEQLGERRPAALSGGQRQRVALARCLVYAPSVILFDEPLGALDKKLREGMQVEIKRLHRQTGSTMLFVTHDQEEALALSDRICVMNQARIEQVGTPQQIYRTPRTLFAAEFIGTSNILRGTVRGMLIETPDGAFVLPSGSPGEGTRAALVIRPEGLLLRPGNGSGVSGQVVETVYAGADSRVLVRLASGTILTARHAGDASDLPIGAEVRVEWPQSAATLLRV